MGRPRSSLPLMSYADENYYIGVTFVLTVLAKWGVN